MVVARFIPFGNEEMYLECRMMLTGNQHQYYFPELKPDLPQPFIFVEIASDLRKGAFSADYYLKYHGKCYALAFKNDHITNAPAYHITSPGTTVACNDPSMDLILNHGYCLAVGIKGKYYLMDPAGKIKGQVR